MTTGKDQLLALLKASGDEEALLDLKILEEEFEGNALEEAVKRRASGEPLAYILGYRHFYKECYKVVPGVLIPRADTEIAVESALKFLGLNKMATGDLLNIPPYGRDLTEIRFADLCTGTGCIGISIANEIVRSGIRAFGTLVDISDTAIAAASDNVRTQAVNTRAEDHADVWRIFIHYLFESHEEIRDFLIRSSLGEREPVSRTFMIHPEHDPSEGS